MPRLKLMVSIALAYSCAVVGAQAFLMWQAQRDGHTIHLLSEITPVSADLLPGLAPEIKLAFQQSEVFVGTINPDVERHARDSQSIMTHALYPEGDSLLNHLPGPTARQLQATALELGIETENMMRLRPWMAARNFDKIARVRAGVRNADRLDRYFYRLAVEDNKSQLFLVKAQDIAAFYDAMPESQQMEILVKTLQDARSLSNSLSASESAWKNADVEAATNLLKTNSADGAEAMKKLMYNQNLEWSEQLAALTENHTHIFVLAPLKHLAGPDNLLERLKEMGFLIAQVLPE